MLLCLDYDGTISEITTDPSKAWPLERMRELLRALGGYPSRIAVAIVSGRDLRELTRLLSIDRGLLFAGVHGLEFMDRDGTRRTLFDTRPFAADLEKVRQWLNRNVPKRAGFLVEDKELALALHYRNADPASARVVCGRFRDFLASEAKSLRAGAGKMVIEALPRKASKAHAVRLLCDLVGESFAPVYFGDDVTDEDAFRELEQNGITVLVGEPRLSRARYRVDGPADVADVAAELVATLEAGG